MNTIYHSPASEAAIHSLYDRQVARLPFPVEEIFVDTRFGRTHLLLAGPKDGVPLITFHGGNSTNPSTLEWIAPLLDRCRVIAPDTLGMPGRSDPARLSPRGWAYGDWAADVMKGLRLEKAAVMGGSYGAGIALGLAACAPERIDKLIVFIPSGLVPIPLGVMAGGLVLPLLRYLLRPSRKNLERILAPMFDGEPVDEVALETSEATFRHVKVEASMPRIVTRADLSRLTAPALVLPGERDRLFPAAAVIRRAKEVIPNLAAAEVIPDSPHFLTPAARGWLCARVKRFLAE